MPNAMSAFGTLLQRGDGGDPESFVSIALVGDIRGPDLALATEIVTSHDSPGGWEEVVGTVIRSGEVRFEINFVPSEASHDGATGLLSDLAARRPRSYRLCFPDLAGTTWSFTALVTGFEPSAPVAGRLSALVRLKVTGQPVLA